MSCQKTIARINVAAAGNSKTSSRARMGGVVV
jgi:hypothetical protein